METKLRFFKLENRWYADVPGHTLAENEMVAGSDDFLDACSQGNSQVIIELSDIQTQNDICELTMLNHNQYGAQYSVSGLELGVPQIWICNVTHDVMGEHPRNIYIQSIIIS